VAVGEKYPSRVRKDNFLMDSSGGVSLILTLFHFPAGAAFVGVNPMTY
jgi:hypothetical protein